MIQLQGRRRRWPGALMVGVVLLVTLSILFLSASALSAQAEGGTGTVSGVVTDQATGRPIPGAQVQISGTVLSSVTDAEGVFRIGNLSPGSVEVRV